MATVPTIYEWQAVPERVSALLPVAARIKVAHEKAALSAGLLATSAVTWEPELDLVTLYAPANTAKTANDTYISSMLAAGYKPTIVTYGPATPDPAEEIIVKVGSLVPGLSTVWNTGNAMLGGPTPLSNGLMTGLLAGGLGYGAGTLAEQFFPERYLERGKLRRTLGLMGALSGVGLAGLNSYANAKALRTSMLRGLLTNNKTPVTYPYEEERVKKSYNMFASPSGGQTGAFSNEPLFSPTVSVPQFNNAAWQDVNMGMYRGFQNHTPPQYAAATTGLMSGISANARSPIIRPVDVINGIASAGVGLATATVAGKALSALAGLTPAGQAKLQDIGLWGGMMHAIVPSLFGR
jgi:hypothetical protein